MDNMKVKFEDDNLPEEEQSVEPDTELKEMLVNYVGNKKSDEEDTVTVEDIIDAVADEFPEFLLVVARENFIRGYAQAYYDNQGLTDTPQVKNEKGNKK